MTAVHLSQNETEVLGLKIGRCNEDFFDENLLKQDLLDGRYDLCRLKIAAEDEMASMKLQQMGFPFFFSGSIRRYKTRITEYPAGEFLHPAMTYEVYDGSQDALLKEMLIGTWGTYPLGYYRSPYLSSLVDKEAEIESVFRFYRHHNLPKNNPNNCILFMNDGGKYVGFFALNIVQGNLESHIGGILEPYRKDGYFLDMLRFIKRYCVDYNLPHFIFGARNENAHVQKIFQEVGFKAIGSENVFHITPFLTHSVTPLKTTAIDLNILTDSSAPLFSMAFKWLHEMNGWRFNSIQFVQVKKLLYSGKYILEASFPVWNDDQKLMVMKLVNNKNELQILAYVAAQ